MLLEAKAPQLAEEAERARDDSRALWRRLRPADQTLLSGAPERCELELTGRYRVGDGNEFPGEFCEISPLGLRIKGPKCGELGNWCTASVDAIGVVEGLVVAVWRNSFVVGVVATPRRLQRLGERLNWQLRRQRELVEERRASERVEMHHAKATIVTAEGQNYSCEIYDLSEGGAALHVGESALYFWLGQPVAFEGREARVLRSFPGGIVIKFE
ncbi:MAG TPA: hypothetical protein VN715_14650 [Roseiarcus sp.]|nr:hypothetical protein [Roseiarcus sp.]